MLTDELAALSAQLSRLLRDEHVRLAVQDRHELQAAQRRLQRILREEG